MKSIITIMGLLLVIHVGANAQDQPAGKVSGYVFGDYFYKMSGQEKKAVSKVQYADSALNKSGAFSLRRMYLYYEHAISENFQAQFLLESNDGSLDGSGRYTTFVKLANLEWKNILPDQNLAFGMIGTPTWALSEKIWGYRSVEKTILDMRGLGGASDVGVSLKGKFGKDGMFGYTTMVSNGNGQKPENNHSRKYYGSFTVKPIKALVVEAYTDHESAITEPKAYNKSASKTTLKAFTAYQTDKFTVGLEAFKQTQTLTDTSDITPLGFSIFASGAVMGKLSAYGRFDTFDPNTKTPKAGYKESFITLGLDYQAHKSVHIMPNLWVNSYSKKGSSPNRDSDVVARITFLYVYNR